MGSGSHKTVESDCSKQALCHLKDSISYLHSSLNNILILHDFMTLILTGLKNHICTSQAQETKQIL